MKEDNIKRILDLGIRGISQKGYHHLGLKQLLDTAGIPKGSFYYYFDSKEDFAQKVVLRYSRNIVEHLKLFLLDKSKSPTERFLTLFDERLNAYAECAYKEGCLMGDLSNELAGQINSMQILLEKEFSAWEEVISQCITEGQKLGEFNQNLTADELANFILNSWEGALTRMKASRSKEPFELFVKYTMNLVLKR